MEEFKPPEEMDWWKKIFDIRVAVVELRPGEAEDEAWSRHLQEHPQDLYANIRVFNCRPIWISK